MTTIFSELFLSLLLALGVSAPGTPVAPSDSPRLAVVADEQGGNFDPNGFTSPSVPENLGDDDAGSFTLLPPEPKEDVDPVGPV